MQPVRAKKNLGQHFLKDPHIAKAIVDSLSVTEPVHVLEIGPGTGILTQYLLQDPFIQLKVIEIDKESVYFLKQKFVDLSIIEGDFLHISLDDLFDNHPYYLIGNLPYNISSQIFFKILPHRDQIPVMVCMLQKEVAERLASPPGNKHYGILSVLLQAFYDIEYLFTVHEHVFDPPPKVKSGVIRLKRNNTKTLECDENLFKQVIKTGFNQRRKTLHNALKPLLGSLSIHHPLLQKRAEQLSVNDFVELTNWIISQELNTFTD